MNVPINISLGMQGTGAVVQGMSNVARASGQLGGVLSNLTALGDTLASESGNLGSMLQRGAKVGAIVVQQSQQAFSDLAAAAAQGGGKSGTSFGASFVRGASAFLNKAMPAAIVGAAGAGLIELWGRWQEAAVDRAAGMGRAAGERFNDVMKARSPEELLGIRSASARDYGTTMEQLNDQNFASDPTGMRRNLLKQAADNYLQTIRFIDQEGLRIVNANAEKAAARIDLVLNADKRARAEARAEMQEKNPHTKQAEENALFRERLELQREYVRLLAIVTEEIPNSQERLAMKPEQLKSIVEANHLLDEQRAILEDMNGTLDAFTVKAKKLGPVGRAIGDVFARIQHETSAAATAGRVIESGFDGLTGAMASAAMGAGKFKDLMKDAARQTLALLIQMTMRALILRAVLALIPGLGVVMNGASAVGAVAQAGASAPTVESGWMTPRANGGPVKAGHLYLTGERGPEPFIPKQDGTILPTSALLGKGGPMVTVVQNFNPGVTQEQLFAGLEATKRAAELGTIDGIRRGKYRL